MNPEFVEEWSAVMRKIPVPRKFISAALALIESGEVEVEKYPTGEPSLTAVYELAAELEGVDATKN